MGDLRTRELGRRYEETGSTLDELRLARELLRSGRLPAGRLAILARLAGRELAAALIAAPDAVTRRALPVADGTSVWWNLRWTPWRKLFGAAGKAAVLAAARALSTDPKPSEEDLARRFKVDDFVAALGRELKALHASGVAAAETDRVLRGALIGWALGADG